jgi:Txe/YoeB family toxin of Txe-Axe toxin-antitoxin module
LFRGNDKKAQRVIFRQVFYMEGKVPRKIEKKVGLIGHSFVAYSQEKYAGRLNEFCPSVKFSARGKGGSGMKWVILKLENAGRGQYDEVIIHSGVNEIAVFKPKSWEKQMRWTINGLREAIRLARKKGVKRIILIEATPWKGYPSWTQDKAEYTLEYNRRLAGIAADSADVELVKLYDKMEGEEPGAMKPGYTADGLHPNSEGLLAIVQEIAMTQYPEWIENWEEEEKREGPMVAEGQGKREEVRGATAEPMGLGVEESGGRAKAGEGMAGKGEQGEATGRKKKRLRAI